VPKSIFLLVLLALVAALNAAGAAELLRDPTRPTNEVPAARTAPATSSLRVSAVFISGERRVAIVNGQRVREGEVISGATVSKIEADKVSFTRKGDTLAVPLLNGGMRK
jgi:MSHA biogenesis protein MshK